MQSFPEVPSADGQPLLIRVLRGNEDGDAVDRANAVTQARPRVLRLVAATPQGERLERFLPEATGEAMTGWRPSHRKGDPTSRGAAIRGDALADLNVVAFGVIIPRAVGVGFFCA